MHVFSCTLILTTQFLTLLFRFLSVPVQYNVYVIPDHLSSMSEVASCDTKTVDRISLTNQTNTLNKTQQSDAELRSRLPRRENHTTGFDDGDNVDEIDIIAGDGYNWFIKEYSPCSKSCMGGM